MTSFNRNLVANFAGVGATFLVQLICVPFYVRLMGIEAYALVGFFLTLQATLQVFDFGVTPTMNRELARYARQPARVGEMRSFVRTFELGYWSVGLALGGLIVLLAPMIATRWVHASAIPSDKLTLAVSAMGALIALQWPLNLYQGGLQGLEKQVRLNTVRIVMAALSGGGGVVILWTLSSDITVFLSWQIAVSLLHVLVMIAVFWASLPKAPGRPRFDLDLLLPTRAFATGMTGITLFGMILIQMDKLVLSRLLPLEAFGYYVLAGTVASGLQLFIRPLYTAIFPRLSALVAARDEGAVEKLYHEGTQLLAVLLMPAAAVLAMFSREVLLAWTGDALAASQAATLVGVLVVGTALHGLMVVPFALQLAYGWTRIGLIMTVSMVLILLPALLVVAHVAGALGAAGIWAALTLVNLAVGVPWTHARLLKGNAGRWLFTDVGLPLAGALLVVGAARMAIRSPSSRLQSLLMVAAISVAATAAAAAFAPFSRSWLRRLRGWAAS